MKIPVSGCIKALKSLKGKEYIITSEFPYGYERGDQLVKLGWAKVITLEPKGYDKKYPLGLFGYKITPDGLDAITQYNYTIIEKGFHYFLTLISLAISIIALLK